MQHWDTVSSSFRYDPAPLRWWGQQLAADARDALHLADQLPRLLSTTISRREAVNRHFGVDHPSHSFNSEPLRWLRLTEVQTPRGHTQCNKTKDLRCLTTLDWHFSPLWRRVVGG